MYEPVGAFAGLVRRAAAGPDRPALLSGDQVTTWRELDARVDAAARGLLALDVPQHQIGGRPSEQVV